MRARSLMPGDWRSVILVVWIALPVKSAGETPADDPARVITSLQQIAGDLTDMVKRFQTHLDREIALHDSGYRSKGGHRIPGADAGLTGGPPGLVQVTTRKLFAARMISARRPGYAPLPLADADRIQVLIEEARTRMKIGNDTLRQLLVVSAKDLNARTEAEQRLQLHELLKARMAAAEAAKKAFVALPIALPGADSPEQQRESAWDLMVAKLPLQRNGAPQAKSPHGGIFPIRFEAGKTITLVNEHFCLVTLTDSGIEDSQGRRLFYQEELVKRPGNLARTTGTGSAGIVISMRWAVAVNTATGQHTLLRRYPTREVQGYFDELNEMPRTDYFSIVELPDTSVPPSTTELTSAVASVERSRDELRDAHSNYKRQVREALARNDAWLAAQNKLALDDDLPDNVRENLFAIRSHMGRVTPILDAESRVRRALDQAAKKIQILEALVAWVNGRALELEGPAKDSRALLETLNRSDTAIHLARSLERQASAALPPDISGPEAKFPALMRDVIVRIRRLGGSDEPGGTLLCRQEIWSRTVSPQGARQVKRTIVPLDIEPKTGRQIPAGRNAKYYALDVGESLEQIYDENSAQ